LQETKLIKRPFLQKQILAKPRRGTQNRGV
jgi:hypothetical protein